MYADSGLLGLARSRRRLRPDGFRGSFFADFATISSWKTENSSWAWAAASDGATLSSSSRLFVLAGLSSSSFFLVNLDSFCFLSFLVGSELKWSISFSNLLSSLFVSLLVFVRFVEVWELLCFSQVLPALTDFFHDVECRQIRVAFWYQTSIFSITCIWAELQRLGTYLTNIMYAERAFFGRLVFSLSRSSTLPPSLLNSLSSFWNRSRSIE